MAQSTKFSMTRDINGYNGFGLMPAYDKFSTTLLANTPQTFTVPNNFGRWLAIFMIEPGDSIWCALNDTAALPGGSVAATTSELNPTAWEVLGGSTISIITADTSDYVGIKFYVLQ